MGIRKTIAPTAVALVLLAGTAVGVAFQRQLFAGRALGPTAEQSATVSSSQPAQAASVALSLPGDTYQLTFDAARDAMWFAVMSPGGPDTLYSYNVKDGRLTDWPLPDSDGNGFMSEIRIGSDGAVWITQDYRVIRFEPSTGETASLDLSTQVEGALPGAVDPGNPLPGTWVSAVAPDAEGGALVARNHVPFLTRLSSALKVRGTLPLPDGFDGTRDIAGLPGGSVTALSGPTQPGSLAVILPTGVLGSQTSVSGLRGNARLIVDSAGGRILVAGARATAYDLRGAGLPLVDSGSGFASWIAVDPRGGVSVYDYLQSSIYRVQLGHVTSQYALPKVTVPQQGWQMGGYSPTSGQGGGAASPQTVADPDIRAIAVDSDGTTWFVVGRDRTLMRIQL
jgi:hypothetical protein